MSSAYVASNKASSTVAANFNATATSFTIATGEGDRFPSPTGGDYTLLVLQNTSGVREIICVVGRTADTFTVGIPGSAAANVAGRNYESIYGMAAAAWVIGDVVSCRPTAGLLVTAVAATAAAAAAQSTANTGVTNAATAQSTADAALPKDGTGTMTGNLKMGAGTKTVYEGTTDDAYELTVDPGEPTADRTQTHQDASGTLALIESNQAQTGIAYTTGGTSTAFTLTPAPALTALAENQEFDVEFNAAAGATPTLAVSGLTAKALKYRDSTGAKQAVTATQVPSGWRSKVVYDGTDYIVREVPPAAAALTLATPQATTSDTFKDFTIPAGTKRITAVLDGVSTSGTSNLLLQFGTGGGIQTNTYVGECYGGQNGGGQSLGTWANGVGLQHAAIVDPADVLRGVVTFTLMDATNNIWGVTGLMYRTGAGVSHNSVVGIVTMPAAVTTLRLTTAGGSDTFDAGSMNIAYE